RQGQYSDGWSVEELLARMRCLRMKTLIAAFLAAALLACGCADFSPAISKADMGNLEVNVFVPEGLDTRAARLYVDDVFIGNISSQMPILQLKRGKRVVKVEWRLN